MKITNGKNASGRDLRVVPRLPRWADYRHIFAQSSSNPIFEKPRPQGIHYPQELGSLLAETGVVRRRILANRSLVYWLACWNFVLGMLVLVAAFSSHLRSAIVLAAILLAIGAVVSFFVARHTGPSVYAAACKLDESAGLQDRLSTTLHFAAEEKPGSIILSQRRDSLSRLKVINTRALFPLQMPANARRTALLALVVVGLLAYRIKNAPPGLTLARKVSQSHLVEAIVSPLARVTENAKLNLLDRPQIDVLDAEAAAAGTAENPEKGSNSLPPGALPSRAGSGDDQKKSSALNPEDSKAIESGPPSQNQSQQNQSQANNTSPSDSTQEGRGQNPLDQDSPKPGSGAKGDSSSQPKVNNDGSKANQQSLGQKIEQALKDMMGSMIGLPSNQEPNTPSPQPQRSSSQGQGGQIPQPGGDSGQQPEGSDGKSNEEKANETPGGPGKHTGVGNGTQQQVLQKPTDPGGSAQTDLVPERVPLDATDFRVQTHPRAMPGPGTSEVPMTNASLTGAATTNGAAQENIPMRYRQYVQRYFDQGQK